ncbi:MAG TPA: glycerophosphodiester phosphodiesterase [Polyangiales bacterium]|nr:glycerophosphodiester phosphodiesterase [Polyangiales bacterium]
MYGHRGTRRGAPENTLTAMRMALAQGADGIELDVRLCATGEVVVLHDPDLQRVAGERVRAAQATLAELQRHDLGGGARVPTLADALELVLGAGKLLNIELKADGPDGYALVAAVAGLLQAGTAAELSRVVLSSFSADICAELCDALPELAVGALFEHVPTSLPSGVCAVHPRHFLIAPNTFARWRKDELLINAWTVNAGARAAQLARLGVDGIITDDVPAVFASLRGD